MKFFIVSETELERLISEAYDAKDPYYETNLKEAEAACRARPVPEWANALLIAEMRNVLPKLLAVVEAAMEEVDFPQLKLRAALDNLNNDTQP